MPTFLFDKIIFGPVQSRRMGVSLGVNLLPRTVKYCNFNCVYCECGFTPLPPSKNILQLLPTQLEVATELRHCLNAMEVKPDAITFAGNGEPTIHPQFCEIMQDVLEIRNEISPKTEIVVLTNATQIHKSHILNTLLSVDRCMFKLDSAINSSVEKINQPGKPADVAKFIEQVKQFTGKKIIQTLFIKGSNDGVDFDNTTDEEVTALIDAYKQIQPHEVVIYGIQRDTPISTLIRTPEEKLQEIAKKIEQIGIKTTVTY